MILKLKTPLVFLVLCFLCIVHTVEAQDALVLTKRKNRRLEKVFFIGDRITFRLKEAPAFETGVISAIEKEGFHTNGRLIRMDDLAVVSENGRGLKFGLGILSMAVGGVILFAGFQGIWVYPLGAAFLGTGLIQAGLYGTRLLLHNRYNVQDKWRFDVRELEKDSER